MLHQVRKLRGSGPIFLHICVCGPEQLAASAAVLPYCHYTEDYGVQSRSITARCRQQALAKLHTYVPNCTALLREVTQMARQLTCI
jgi:hypothetical protein